LWLRNIDIVNIIAGHCVRTVNENALRQELAYSLRQKAEAAGQIIENVM